MAVSKNQFITKPKKLTEAKKVSVSYESQQETTIMALLAQCGICFAVYPPRKSCDNCQFIDIHNVHVNGISYDFEQYIHFYICEQGKELSPSSKHYKKYQKRNQIAATNNILSNMLKTIGWKISFKNSKEASITLKMERINVLSFGEIVINGEDIALIGEKLNKELKSVMSRKSDTPLMISSLELPIDRMIDMKSIWNNVDLSSIQHMFNQVNVSYPLCGEVIMNDVTTMNQMNVTEMNNDNVCDEQDQSQNYIQNKENSSYGSFTSFGSLGTSKMVKDERRKEDELEEEEVEKELEENKEIENDDDELPPATNIQQFSQCQGNQSTCGFSTSDYSTCTTDYNVLGYLFVDMNGQTYIINSYPYYYIPHQESSTQQTSSCNEAMVESIHCLDQEIENDNGFVQITNYYMAV